MSPQLTKIEIDNWKSLKTVSIELDDINVLIGQNGTGKSNLVQFFHMLNMMMTGNLQLFVGRSGGANSLLHYGSKTSVFIDSKLTFKTESGTDTYSFRLMHGAPDTLIFSSENVTFKASNHPGDPFFQEFGAGHKETALSPQMGQQNEVFRFIRSMLSRCRYFQFHDTTGEAHIRGTSPVDNDRFLFHNGGNVAAVLNRLRVESPEVFQKIVTRVRATVPAFRDFVLEPQNGFVRIDWIDAHKGQQFGPHQLSDGSIRAIGLHTLLALPAHMSPSVIIIDEPELGLFPAAIDVLVDAIKEASAQYQIILATQSNRLVRYLNPQSLVCCSWKDGESSVRRLSPADEFTFMDDYTLGDYMSR